MSELIINDAKTGQTAKFFIPSHHKKIAVHVSSGKDSALCLYFLCQYLMENKRTDVTIFAAHVRDLVRVPYSEKDFNKVIDEFEKQFPELTFKRHVVNYVERSGYPKIIETRKQMKVLIEQYGVQSVFGGRTNPPPLEFLEQLKIESGREEIPAALVDRMPENVTKLNIRKALDENLKVTDDVDNCKYMFANPLLTTNSFFSVEQYKKIPFMRDVIFPLTRSCVGSPWDTDFWKKPCKECWWCREKKKIFGAYDGEQIQ
jgi:7-cyano-7-deazaguanine synthase in queuosine biosynthesis